MYLQHDASNSQDLPRTFSQTKDTLLRKQHTTSKSGNQKSAVITLTSGSKDPIQISTIPTMSLSCLVQDNTLHLIVTFL